jgi:hypothetical protein
MILLITTAALRYCGIQIKLHMHVHMLASLASYYDNVMSIRQPILSQKARPRG